MKIILTLAVIFAFISCDDNSNLKFVDQQVISGKVSAVKAGVHGAEFDVNPIIWVQSPTETKKS